jgi:hypothetical protein
LHSDIAPLPNPAKHVFEQQYGVLRSKSSYNPLENAKNHRSPLAFHRFWDGLVIAFSSFLHSDIAPLPNPAKHVFEQQYGVLRLKSSFQSSRKRQKS